MRDLSKIRCYRCDELGHIVRDCPQLRDQMGATAAMASNDSEGDALKISDKIFTFFSSGF